MTFGSGGRGARATGLENGRFSHSADRAEPVETGRNGAMGQKWMPKIRVGSEARRAAAAAALSAYLKVLAERMVAELLEEEGER